MMKPFNRMMIGLMVLATASSAFAITGKTMYHYIAYQAMFWPKSLPVNADSYAKVPLGHSGMTLDGLVKLPFDTLVFAPMFGFGSMAANLKSATYPKHQPIENSRFMPNQINAMPALIKAGVDPTAEIVKWCRKNKREAVVALPTNLGGRHNNKPDEKHTIRSWQCYLWPEFKDKNADALVDPDGKGPCPNGYRYAVDYTNPKVRKTFSDIACEIAGKYDIDGLMIDFTMEPTLFRSVAAGGTAAPKEVQLITDMMTTIKAACKAASGRLGHPVAFAARVPDSIGYCKDIGIDLQGWLDTKMLDYVVLGGSFQLNRSNAVGDIAAKNGIPFYVSFTQSGILVGNDDRWPRDDERVPRHCREACNARIAEALVSKATGCMYTMGIHHDITFPYDLCEPYDAKHNRLADKRYFISYSDERVANSFLKDGMKYRIPQSLISMAPVDLAKGMAKYKIDVWDDLEALAREGKTPKVTLITEVSIPSGIDTDVTFNGKVLKCFKKRAGTQMYALSPKLVKKGANEVLVKSKGKNKRSQTAKLGNIVVEVTFEKPAKKEG